MVKQQNKIPEVRFPEFKEEWEHKQLNELLSVSKTKNSDLKYGKEEVLSVSGDLGIVNQIEHLGRSYAGASVHNYGVVELNQIVYTKSPLKANPYGIIKLNKHKAGIVSTLYAVYNVNEETDGQFIEYYFSLDANLNRYLRPLVRKGAKNDMKISNEYVLNDRIYAPQLKEQQKIAHFFSILDKKLTQLQEKKNALELYKKGMMQQIFCQQLRFKDDNGHDFPEWEVKKLGEILTKKSSNISANNIEQNYGDYIIYGASGVLKKVDFYKEEDEYISIIKDGAGVGRVYLCKAKTSVLGTLDILKVKKDNLPFMFFFLETFNFLKYITGSTIPHIYFSDYKNAKIQLPTLPEQTKIANFLSKIDDKINTATEKIEQTKAYKKGLLQRMFV